jgi:hypothetical protein
MERKQPATETTVRCQCSPARILMHLVEPMRQVRPPAPPMSLYVTEEELAPEQPGPSDSTPEPVSEAASEPVAVENDSSDNARTEDELTAEKPAEPADVDQAQESRENIEEPRTKPLNG